MNLTISEADKKLVNVSGMGNIDHALLREGNYGLADALALRTGFDHLAN